MDHILDSNAAPESVHSGVDEAGRPRAEWVRGVCPQCGEVMVSNCYYVGGKRYLVTWDCWASLGNDPTCTYRKVL